MRNYTFQAVDSEGKKHSGLITAGSDTDAARILRSRGLFTIKLTKHKQSAAKLKSAAKLILDKILDTILYIVFGNVVGVATVIVILGWGIGYGVLVWKDSVWKDSEYNSYRPANKTTPVSDIIAVKEISQGGDLGIIGTRKGPRGFITVKKKSYEVTYEDKNGVIRTEIMSSDPTK